jgi:HEAT repeat protein
VLKRAVVLDRLHWSFPVTLRGRLALLLAVLVAVPLASAGAVLFSIWSEYRAPSDAADATVLTRARGTVTKPILDLVNWEVQRRIDSRTQATRWMTGLSPEERIARFLDGSRSLSERRIHAYGLAAEGTPEAVAALLAVLETAPSEHKAFILQAMGSTGNPAMKPYLWPYLDDADGSVSRAAMRGLCAIGGGDVRAELARMLGAADVSAAMRGEAARGLGQLGTPAARDALVAAFPGEEDTEVATQIVESLGRFPFPKVAAAFEDILSEPAAEQDVRIAAVEALASSSQGAVTFLLNVAAHDGDAEVRASAAWAAGMHDAGEGVGPWLAELAAAEPDADVRRRLYEALLPQSEIPAEDLLPTIRAEQDVAARVAGFNTVGGAVGRDPSAALAIVFDSDIVPELQRIAESENSLNIRMRAVFGLRRARTPAAREALAAIAAVDEPRVAAAARHGL